MIINAGTICATLAAIGVAAYLGLKLVRAFALQIARENHDAVLAMDRQEETLRLKRQQRSADAAAESAFAKVRPILTTTAAAATNATSASSTAAIASTLLSSGTGTTPPPSSSSSRDPSSTPPPGIVASASV